MKVAALVLLALLLAPAGSATVVWKEDVALPNPWYGSGRVWTGTHAYLFGNSHIAGRDHIVRFDPATLEVATMAARLPHFQRAHQAAAWTGTHAYLFGGLDGPKEQDRAMRYDPASDTLTVLPARMPGGVDHATAAYDPRVVPGCPAGCIYIVGGTFYDRDTETWVTYDTILRYDPSSDTYTTLPVRLPSPLLSMDAVFDGRTIWIFGGQDARRFTQDEIYAFDPLAGTLRQSGTRLPEPRYSAAVVWNGSAVLYAGGRGLKETENSFKVAYYDDILAFDPVMETLTDLGVAFPTGRWGGAILPAGDGAFVLGGMQYEPVNTGIPDILRYDARLAPPPASVTATPGPGRGEVTVSFTDSPESGVTGYEVQRVDDGAIVASVAAAGAIVDPGPEGAVRSYRVRALNAAGAGPYGNVVSAMPPGLPSAPTGPAARAGPGPADIRVTWKAPADDGGSAITAYRVYGGDAPDALALLGDAAGLAFVDSGLAPGATRWYRVSAVTALGEGPASAVVSGTAPVVPGPPANTKATAGLQRIDVAWAPPNSDGGTAVTGYAVYRGKTASSLALVATVGDVRAWSDTGRGASTTYVYRVAAINGVGEGPTGGAVSATALGPGAYKVSFAGGVVLYHDVDDDNVVDPGEAVLTTAVLP